MRDRAIEAQQRAEAQAAVADARAARLQQQMQVQSNDGATERPLTDAQRQAIVAAARRAAIAEIEEEELTRARALEKRASRQKSPRTGSDRPRADREKRSVATAPSAKPQVAATPSAKPQASSAPSAKPQVAATPSTKPQVAAVEGTGPKGPAAAPAPPSARDDATGKADVAAADRPRTTPGIAGERTDAPVASAAPAGGASISLGDESFHPGAPYLRPGATRALDPVAEFLRAHPDRKVRISGVAAGPDRELSGGRTNEVRAALLRRGVAASRIQVVAATGTESRGAARVDVVVSDERGRAAR
jgi:outer membrane protein OmpA-like peptidoglycan-associated protein